MIEFVTSVFLARGNGVLGSYKIKSDINNHKCFPRPHCQMNSAELLFRVFNKGTSKSSYYSLEDLYEKKEKRRNIFINDQKPEKQSVRDWNPVWWSNELREVKISIRWDHKSRRLKNNGNESPFDLHLVLRISRRERKTRNGSDVSRVRCHV